MSKKTRAPGGGRKPLDPSGSEIVQVRIPGDLRRAIGRLGKKQGLRRSGIIRAALWHFVGRFQVGRPHTEALASAIVLLADQIERRTGKKWIADPVTGEALRQQVDRLIFHFACTPAEPVVVPPEADVVGFVITAIENAVPVKGVPPKPVWDDQGYSAVLWSLAQQPPYGLGSGWQRNRTVWQGKAKA